MHPEVEYRVAQARWDEIHREAAERRSRSHSVRRRLAAAVPTAPVLSPGVQRVLVFAERDPSPRQLEQLLAQLKDLHDEVITALMYQNLAPARASANEAGDFSLTLPTPGARIPAQRPVPEAERHLSHVVEVLRDAGHDTTGEVVTGSMSRLLLNEVSARRPEAVILLTGRRRHARLPRRDLERRLRRHTDGPVLAVVDERA